MFDNILILLVIIGLIALFAALAGSVGIGGGGFFTPILMIVGGLSIFVSIPLACSIIAGVGLASTFVNAKNKTINYRIGIILEPFTILGTIFGVQLHLSAPEWIITGILVSILFLLAIRSYYRARKTTMLRNDSDGEIDYSNFTTGFNNKKCLFLGISGSFLAGVISALVGIGGGLIKVPLMNELGLSPIISSGTGSFMVLFTSLATVFQFMLYNRLRLLDGLFFFVVGFLASLVGTQLSRYINRPDVIQYLLTVAIAGSCFLILLNSLVIQ